MSEWQVPLADVRLADAEIEPVVDTLRSGWLTMGPRTEELELAFADYTGSRHAIAVSNGTAALHLICLAAGLGPGDEVIVPSLTFVATANAVSYTGATPVFCDVASTLEPWLSVESAEAAIGERTKAIMAMAYGGHPGQAAELLSLSREHGLTLLEDAAHAPGAKVGRRHVGTLGLAGAFSFFSNKNVPVGEGGMVVTDDDEAAEQIRLLRSHGMTSATWERHGGRASSYDVIAEGFNYRIDEPRAALALARLARLDVDNAARHELVAGYRRDLVGHPALTPTSPASGEAHSADHLFTGVLAEGIDRDRVRNALAERGIQTSVHYPPVHRFSMYEGDWELPVTESYAERSITLPLFPHMSDQQRAHVIESVRSVLGGQPVNDDD